MKQWVFPVAVVVATGAFLLWVSGAGPLGLDCGDFSSEDWREQDRHARGDLADLLLECDTLNGLTREQTIQLLGNPDYGTPGAPYKGKAASWIFARAFIDDAVLFVQFDAVGPEGRVFQARKAFSG